MITRRELATIASALQASSTYLQNFSSTPRLDVELLLTYALDRPRSYLYAYTESTLTAETQDFLVELIERRANGEPIAYILGQKEFYALEFSVTRDTLIPRPETEHLVDWVLANLGTQAMIADLGTGSGAIAITLAHQRPHWQVHATDASMAALTVAIQNAERYHLHNIEFYLGDWYQALPKKNYTAIISNPPYIAADDPHLANLKFEPHQALCAAEQGLAAFKQIIAQAKSYLKTGGNLVLEHGYQQAPMLMTLLQENGFKQIQSYCDLGEQTRFVVGTKD